MEKKEKITEKFSEQYQSLTGPIRYHLTNDYMFRAVMQKNENVLKHLLCAILGIAVESVTDLQIMNPIVLGEEIESKTCVLDIKLLINNNHYYNIEMQVTRQNYWQERSLTYLCRLYDNLESGQEYDEVVPAIQISILDFNLFENVEELCSRYYLMNENPKYYNRYTDGFGIFTLNLLQIQNEDVMSREKNKELCEWARVFKAESWEEIRMLAEKNEAIDECIYTMAKLSEDDKIRMQCDARNDSAAIEKGVYKRGFRKGRDEGIALGRDEGIALGRTEGAEQQLVQICSTLKKKMTTAEIADMLEEEEDYIKELINKYHL